MGTDFETRKQELIDESEVSSSMFNQVSDRLKEFMVPFVSSLVRREQVDHAHTLVQGLLSDLEHKNTETIAYHFGQPRMPLQWFMGVSDWDHGALRDELVRQVGER